ncbi:hypothetical protein [Nocardia sp. NPDC003963]
MPVLGYQAGRDDLIVGAVHSKLNQYTRDPRFMVKMWGIDPAAVRPEDYLRIENLIRVFVFEEDRILAALRRLDERLAKLKKSDTAFATALTSYLESLTAAAEKRCPPPDPPETPIGHDPFATTQYGEQVDYGDDDDDEDEAAVEAEIEADTAAADEARARRRRREAIQRRSYAHPNSIIDFTDPEVARPLGDDETPVTPEAGFQGEMWRLMDIAYDSIRIPHNDLRELVDLVLAVQAEYQLQCLLIDREMSRVIDTRGREFDWLTEVAVRKYLREQGEKNSREAGKVRSLFLMAGGVGAAAVLVEKAIDDPLTVLGDLLGIISAVSGVLALIPALTPLCGPIAVVSILASLALHTADAIVKGDWDAGTVVGLGADVIGAIPGIGALSKAVKAGTMAMRAGGTMRVALRHSGQAFRTAVAGASAAEAGMLSNYLGSKGAAVVGASAERGIVAGKVIQGAFDLTTQVPAVINLVPDTSAGAGAPAAAGAYTTRGVGELAGAKVGSFFEAGGKAFAKGGNGSLKTLSTILRAA